MNISVGGITQLKQLQQLDGLNIDFAGLVFDEQSPQYVVGKISKEDLQATDFDIKKTGIFVNADFDTISEAIEDYGLDVVLLHGDETPELCEELSESVEVIKAFSISDSKISIDDMIEEYDEVCDYYLFDNTDKDGLEGTIGKPFDWKVISKARIEKPFFISGGIGVEEVANAKKIKHPDFYGISVNGKFEKTPGVKDMSLLLQLKQGSKK